MIIFTIINSFLDVILSIFGSFFDNLTGPNFNWDWMDSLFELLDIAFYLIPVYDLLPLISIICLIGVIRIVIALLKFIFDAIPLY